MIWVNRHNRRVVKITPELLCSVLAMFCSGVTTVKDGMTTRAVSDGIPETAKGIRCGINERGDVELLIEDESFSLVEEGCAIPILEPTFITEYAERLSP